MTEYKVKVYDDRTEWRNLEGKFHRENGPAIEHSDGYKSWWINGQRHRIDGPAIEWDDGYKEWYINGTYYSRSEYYHKLKLLNCPEYLK